MEKKNLLFMFLYCIAILGFITLQSNDLKANGLADEPVVVYALNCGGEDYLSFDNIEFTNDSIFLSVDSTDTYAVVDEIENTDDDVLFQSERYIEDGNLEYNLPLENGQYEVTLMFAEIWFQESGKRILNVYLEDQKVIAELDVVGVTVSRFTAYEETFTVTVADGQLDILLERVLQNPKINAIIVTSIPSATGITTLPKKSLLGNYPNPFSSQTTISYQINTSNNVDLSVYNLLGEKVVTLVSEFQQAGNYSVNWNAVDAIGKNLEAGVYFYCLKNGDALIETNRTIISK